MDGSLISYIISIEYYFDFDSVLCCLIIFESSFRRVMFDRCQLPSVEPNDMENWIYPAFY